MVDPSLTPACATKRKAISRRIAVEIVLSQEGRCTICKQKLIPKNIAYDHVHPLALGGADDISNLAAICADPCHRKKTSGNGATSHGSDIGNIAKTRRLESKRLGISKEKSGPKIKSRGFAKSHSKKFNGQIVERLQHDTAR